MGHHLQYYAAQVFVVILKVLPLSASLGFARRMGDLAYVLLGDRRRITIENITRALGPSLAESEKKRIARASFQCAAMTVLELFLIKKIKKNWQLRFDIKGREYLEEALARGNGVVLVSAHLGSWEFLPFLFHALKARLSAIVKTAKNVHLDREVNKLRSLGNLVPIPKKGSIKTVLTELKSGHGVAILTDQWDGDNGIWTDFFGIPTSATSLPARLAQKTGAALVPAYCLRKGDGYFELQVRPPIYVDPNDDAAELRVTEKINRLLEDMIREYPEQWLWAHRRWKKKPVSITSSPRKRRSTTLGSRVRGNDVLKAS